MASSSKRPRLSFISAEMALEKIFEDEDSADGIIDRQLENESGGSRWEVNIGLCEMVAIAHVVLKCEFVRPRLPFCYWFLAYFLTFDYKLVFATLKINNLR